MKFVSGICLIVSLSAVSAHASLHFPGADGGTTPDHMDLIYVDSPTPWKPKAFRIERTYLGKQVYFDLTKYGVKIVASSHPIEATDGIEGMITQVSMGKGNSFVYRIAVKTPQGEVLASVVIDSANSPEDLDTKRFLDGGRPAPKTACGYNLDPFTAQALMGNF